MLATQAHGNDRGKTAQNDALGVDQIHFFSISAGFAVWFSIGRPFWV